MTSRPASSTLRRMIYGGFGWCAVALAFAGVFVPGLPVTVFVLIASWCFARSSPRFEDYLRTNRWFGPRLRRFQDSGGMPRSAKIAALACMWIAIAISSTVLASVSTVASLITIALGGIGTLTIVFAVRTVTEVSFERNHSLSRERSFETPPAPFKVERSPRLSFNRNRIAVFSEPQCKLTHIQTPPPF